MYKLRTENREIKNRDSNYLLSTQPEGNLSIDSSVLGKIGFEGNLGNDFPTYDLDTGNLGGFLGGFGR